MRYRITVFILIVAIVFLPSCSREKLFDSSELSMRLAQIDERYAFSGEQLLIEDKVSRVFYSLSGTDDILLSMTQAENGRLSRVELTVLSEGTSENLFVQYEYFCAALTAVFLSETQESARTLCTDAGLLSRENYFTDFLNKTALGRYEISLWSCPLSMSFIITYNSETLRASD